MVIREGLMMFAVAALLFAPALGTPALGAQRGAQPPTPTQRFDYLVRGDFFAGMAGDAVRFKKAMDTCERALAENPKNAEAMVWHGAGVFFSAGQAFQKGDTSKGIELYQAGLNEMAAAVALAPDNVGVLIPRGATLLQAAANVPPERARPLVETAVGDYERVLVLQKKYFGSLGDHAKGELLFGLAEGYARLGQPDQARAYFQRLLVDAPTSGEVPRASAWLATGTVPSASGLHCAGCHK